jgi:chromate transporter
VLPWAHRVLVEERRWITSQDFTETLALCQVLPGPNVANVAIVLGRRWFGLAGAAAAFLGLMALPFVWVLALAALYGEFASSALVSGVVTGVGAAGAGLFIATGIKLGRPLAGKRAALALAAACFVAIALARLSLVVVLPAAAAVGLLLVRKRLL